MTQDEYDQLANFKGLPLYEADDARADSITRINDPNYTGAVHEAMDMPTAYDFDSRPKFEPKGAIRYGTDEGSPFIYVYYWKLR